MTSRSHIAVRAAALLALAAIGLGHAGWWVPRQPEPLPLAASEPGIERLAPLFARQDEAASAPDQLVPELLGVAGRLPDDAEVLVRTASGKSDRLRIGASAAGWTVVAIAADSATFEREGVRKIVRLKHAP